MPNKRVLVRNYSISDGTIIQLADAIGNTVTRDMADLSVYGITPATVTELETLREDFANLLDDAYYVGMQLSATESKNKIRDELETTVRSLATRAEIKLGTKSPNWARFGLGAISLETDEKLLRTAKRAHRMATLFQPDLAFEGIDAACS